MESSSKTFLVNISEEDAMCNVCNNIMLEPKILSCGHRICEYCVNVMIATDLKLCCPYCRAPFSIQCNTDSMLKNIISQITVELECSKKIKASDIKQHVSSCLKCLKNEYEKTKNLCEMLLIRKKKHIERDREDVSQMFYGVLPPS
jgi:hypothetical protein